MTENIVLILNLISFFIFATLASIYDEDHYVGFASVSLVAGWFILPVFILFLLWKLWIRLVKRIVEYFKNTQ